MVIRILKGDTIFGPLNYNYSKENKEVAEVLGSANFPFDGTPDFSQARVHFQAMIASNRNIDKPVFTASINPAPEDLDRITDSDYMEMAKEYMQKMGYGEQPYLVFKHSDIERTHIHIVTVRVKPDGTPVSDKFEQKRSSQIRRAMEIEYSLTKAEDKRDRKSESELLAKSIERTISAKEQTLLSASDKRRYIRRALRQADAFGYRSINELNRILSAYGVEAERVGEGTPREGLLFYALDSRGERAATPIKGSAVAKEFSATKVRERMEENEKKGLSKEKKEETKNALERWLRESRSIEELASVLKGEGIEIHLHKRKSGEVTGLSVIDRVNRIVCKGSELGKGYSYKAIEVRLEKNKAEYGSVKMVSEEDFKQILSVCAKTYRAKRADTKTYYYESQLIDGLQSLREEFLQAVKDDGRFGRYADTSLMRAVDSYLGLKRSSRGTIVEKENEYFLKTSKKYVPYALSLEPERRSYYLAALGMGQRDGFIYSLRDNAVCIPLSEYGLSDYDLTETGIEETEVKPISKKDRQTLSNIIEDRVGEIDFEEYKPYHRLLKMLSEQDKGAFLRRQTACEAERTFKESATISDCVTKLLEKGLLVIPVRTAEGKRTYAIRDFASTDTSRMTVVSDEVRDRLDRVNYSGTLLPNVKDKVYDERGYIRPEYRAVVRLVRASSIDDPLRRDKETEKAFKYLESYDTALAKKMRDMYARGERISKVASELEGKTLKRNTKYKK